MPHNVEVCGIISGVGFELWEVGLRLEMWRYEEILERGRGERWRKVVMFGL